MSRSICQMYAVGRIGDISKVRFKVCPSQTASMSKEAASVRTALCWSGLSDDDRQRMTQGRRIGWPSSPHALRILQLAFECPCIFVDSGGSSDEHQTEGNCSRQSSFLRYERRGATGRSLGCGWRSMRYNIPVCSILCQSTLAPCLSVLL